MRKYFILSCIFELLVIKFVKSDSVLGCGGFVKSDMEINFSLVEVKLYTPHGSIKYQTDCAPNTGYYLIPLYDKGDFVLKVEPPPGWTFEPESVELHVDGEKDKCSLGEDINFIFTGFSLNGKVVSKGQSSGPAGVSVNLYKSGSKEVLQTVQTGQDGSYQFQKVLPGKYDVRAMDGGLRFEKSETSVELSDNNADAGSSLVIAGYSVSGKVYSDGEPIRGVYFLLYSAGIAKQHVQGCEKNAVPGTNKKDEKLLCYVSSTESGQFNFPCLPTGTYDLVPFYKGEHITFDVVPEKMTFEVHHSNLQLKDTFQVAGFSVTGQVLDSEKGKGVPDAEIILNGNSVTRTATDGTYHLENMKTGMYKLQVKATDVFFDETEVKITPNTPQLPNIVAARFSLCGKVKIDKFPEGLSQQNTKRKLIIFPEGKGSEAVSKETSEDGSFCKDVAPGKYIVRVHMTDIENKAGLTISPPEHTVTITNKPVLDVLFSQFRAKVTGTVTCIEKCGIMEVSVESLGRNDKQIVQTQGNQQTSTFTIENVLPGKYKATILKDALCWKNKTIEFEVISKNVDNVQFTQTGYILKCTISHSITLNFAHDKKEGSVGSFELNKGKNRFCLAEPGLYKLTPDSCHKFEKEVYTYDTSTPETLTLTAVSHLVQGTVKTEEPVLDIVVTVSSSIEQSTPVNYPLTLTKTGKDGKPVKGPQVYTFSHWARSGEKLTATVKSAEVLFTPQSMTVTVIGDTCPGELFKFIGEKGEFIVGEISPKLSGVKITVTSPQGSMEPVVSESSESGQFRIGPLMKNQEYKVAAEKEGYVIEREEGKNNKLLIGPLMKNQEYKVAAEKEGYVIEREEGKNNVFRAFKLGRISVLNQDYKVSAEKAGYVIEREEGKKNVFRAFKLGRISVLNQEYKVTAEKEGYVIEREEGKKNVFRAFKLGRISVLEYKVTAEKEGYVIEREEGKKNVFRAFKLGRISVLCHYILMKNQDYKVAAEKEGYVIEREEGKKNVFRAFKLGRISVLIVDEQGVPLSDVLLSLSGGKQYRSNNLTKEDGSMLFADLNPGQYFLRPMMKEYNFDPASQMIDVLEGTTMDIKIKGLRTAYSCYGQVTSLNGEPEQGLFVEAQGTGKCEMYQEESKTDQLGNYRIRGLQPDCSYEVRLKIGEMNKHIERAAPKSRLIVVQKSDFVGVNIIAFRRMNQMDISGNVVTDPAHLKTLKVRLYKEDNPGVPMYTANLGEVCFFYLPSLQIDDKMYTVRLESSLSKSTHEFTQPEVELQANVSYKHITFHFEAKRKSIEQELSQGSVLFLPFSILVAYAIYNYQKLLPVLQGMIAQLQNAIQQKRQAAGSPAQPAPVVQEFDIPDSPVSKKKNRQRKT